MRGPPRRSLRKATRTAIVASAAFLIGRYAVDDDQFAVLASFAAFSLAAFADFGGSARARLAAYLAAATTGVPLVALGTALSDTTWAVALTMAAVGFLVTFAGLFGGYAAAGVTAVILFFVVAAGVQAPEGAIGPRLAGLATGVGLAALGSVTLWPDRARSDFRRPLAAALHAVASWLGAVTAGSDAGRLGAQARAAVAALRPELAQMVDRPAGPTRVDRGQVYLIYNLDRLEELADRLDMARARTPATDDDLVSRAGQVLDDAGRVLEGGVPGDAVTDLLHDLRSDVAATPKLLRQAAAHGEPHQLLRACERIFTAQELAATAAVAHAHATAAAGRGQQVDLAGGAATLRVASARGGGPVATAWRKARVNLTPRSAYFRAALRMGLGLGAALGVVRAFDLQHGFWVALAALVVMRTSARETSVTAARAVTGVGVGFCLSLTLVLLAAVDHWVYAVVLPPAFFGSVIGTEWLGLAAGQASFCVAVVALFNLLKPSGWELGIVRVEDVVVGAVVGVVIGVAIWPHGAAGQLRSALAALLREGAAYAALAARISATGGSLDEGRPARQRALGAARRAEDAFAAYLGERRPSAPQLAVWSEVLVAGDRLWYTADRAAWRAGGGAAGVACAALVAELEGSVRRLESGYAALASAVETRGVVAEPPLGAPRALDDAALACMRQAGNEGAAAAGLLWARYYLGELFDGLRHLSAALVGADDRSPHASAGASLRPPRWRARKTSRAR